MVKSQEWSHKARSIPYVSGLSCLVVLHCHSWLWVCWIHLTIGSIDVLSSYGCGCGWERENFQHQLVVDFCDFIHFYESLVLNRVNKSFTHWFGKSGNLLVLNLLIQNLRCVCCRAWHELTMVNSLISIFVIVPREQASHEHPNATSIAFHYFGDLAFWTTHVGK